MAADAPTNQGNLTAALEETQRRLSIAEAERDEYAHRLRKSGQTRWARLGTALRAARRSWRALLSLPVVVLRIVFGPPVEVARQPARPLLQAIDAAADAPTAGPVTVTPRARLLTSPHALRLKDLRVAAVVDEFTQQCLEPDCNLLADFRPDNWRVSLETFQPHLVFIESAWKGNGGSWQYQVGKYSYAESVGLPHLSALVQWARAHGVPTVFWNKEDPVHFDRFRDAARLTDVVLTTDQNCVPAYQALQGLAADVVDVLPFAAQPHLHTPIGAPREREPVCAFAGSFYRNRHVDRRRQLEVLLRAAANRGLVIFDRNNGQVTDTVGFPDEFQRYIQGGLPYHEMVEAYRRFRIFLNVNSVIDSPTMCSRRVFEILASGTPVVSTSSPAIDHLLPGVVDQADDAATAKDSINRLLDDDSYWRKRSLQGRRAVLRSHTYAHRLARVAAAAGLPTMLDTDGPATAVIATADAAVANEQLAALARVRPGWAVLVLGPAPDVTAEHPRRRDVPRGDDVSETLRRVAETAADDWLLVLGDEGGLDHDRLVDLDVTRRLVDADAIGTSDVADQYVTAFPDGPVLVRRSTVGRHGWPVEDAARQQRLHDLGVTFFATATAADE